MSLDRRESAGDARAVGSVFANVTDQEVLEYVQAMVLELEGICLNRNLNVMTTCLKFARVEAERLIQIRE